MKVLGNNVLVKPILKETSAIITTTDEKEELTDKCEIVAVGNQVDQIKPGSTCVYNYRSGQPLDVDGVGHILIKDYDVYVIL